MDKPSGILFIDTETTGMVDFRAPADAPHQPRIVQLAVILTDTGGRELAKASTLIRPDGWTIDPAAQAIHKISVEDCAAFGVPIGTALNLLFRLAERSIVVEAHNLDFDARMIEVECKRAGKESVLKDLAPFCTMREAKHLVKLPGGRDGDFKWPKLTECMEYFFDRPLVGSHNATNDVQACKEIYFAVLKQIES